MPPELEYGPTEPAPRCEAHDGAHALYLGHCVAVGAQVPRPFLFSRLSWYCECGRRVYGAVERATMRRWLLDEATGTPHECPPVVRVQLDERTLATALAGAFEEVRRHRQPSPRPEPSEAPPPPPMRPSAVERGALGGIPRLDG